MTNLSEVIHFYIGQPYRLCLNIEGNPVDEILTVKLLLDEIENPVEGEKWISKPILSRLSSMTEEQAKQIIILAEGNLSGLYDIKNMQGILIIYRWRTNSYSFKLKDFNADQFLYLIKEGFDLFGLIDSNQAIDKNEVK